MTKYVLAEAIGNISDRYVYESALFRRKSAKKLWIIISATAACAAFVFVALGAVVQIVPSLFLSESPDPHWHESHLLASSNEEAVIEFGDDLLLDKMIIDGISDKPYEQYVLTFSNGDSKLRSNWEWLECEIYYGDFYPDTDNQYIDCCIAFTYEEKRICKNDFEKDSHVVSSETLNGVYVEYGEEEGIINGIYYYGASALFTYNDIQYHLSSKDLQLVIDTVRQMLA